jgi:thioredoxin family protein
MKKALLAVAALSVALVATAAVLYVTNWAPAVPALSAADVSNTARPYVVKLHAKWCPVCMVTKGVWSQIASTYGTRANLVVFDFTNQATTDASRVEARRLGLEKFFDQYDGATGIIAVLDGRTKKELASIGGSRDFADYRTAIDAALGATP